MSDLVDSEVILDLFGVPRQPFIHLGMWDGATFLIMHSVRCLRAYEDLRECEYSLAMDEGIEDGVSGIESFTLYELRISDGGYLHVYNEFGSQG